MDEQKEQMEKKEKKERNEKKDITMKDIFLKLIDAIFGVAIGACKGLKYLMTAFPFILLGFVVLLVFFHEQTVAALDTIKLLIG